MSCTMNVSWAARRMELLRTCKASGKRPRGVSDADIASLSEEGLFDVRPDSIQITAAGSLLRTIAVMATREGGPWTVAEIHQSKHQMAPKEIETCLKLLQEKGIIKAVPSKRGTKWDLSGK